MKTPFVLASIMWALVLTGCKNDAWQATPTPDTSSIGRQSDTDLPPYKVRVRMDAPCYLCNDVSPNTRVGLTLKYWKGASSIEQAKQIAMGQMTLESFPGRVPVKGRWDVQGNSSYRYVPDQPLAPGDYLVLFANAGPDLQVSPVPYNLFRVGPGVMRLRTVELYSDKSDPSGGLAKVVPVFTTFPDPSLGVELEKEVDGAWKTIALSKGAQAGESIKANVSDTIPTDIRLRVTVRSDLLDGAYTGVAGSKKAIAVVFRPQDVSKDPHQVIYHVPPQLGIDLLTGKPTAGK